MQNIKKIYTCLSGCNFEPIVWNIPKNNNSSTFIFDIQT